MKRGLRIIPDSMGHMGGGGLSVADGGAAPSTLLTGLSAYYAFSESSDGSASFTRYDALGVSNLTDTYGGVSVPGKVGLGLQFDLDTRVGFTTATATAALSPNTSSFVWTGWIKTPIVNRNQRFINKDNDSTQREYVLRLANKRVQMFGWFGAGAGTIRLVEASTFGDISINTWYFVCAYFDAPNHQIGISINGGAFNTTDTVDSTMGVRTCGVTIGSGRSATNVNTEYFTGNIDEIGMWKGRLLTATEIAALYNGGAGLTYPFSGATPSGVSAFNLWANPTPTFTRAAGNPIVALGGVGEWDHVDVANPDVFYDTPNSRWVMNYSGWDGTSWKTGLAYSTDLTTWTKEAENPVLEPAGGEAYIAANGSIVLKAGTYYLYYQANVAARIYLATSTDLINWTRQNSGNPVIDVGASGAWDDKVTADPHARLLGDGTIEVQYLGFHNADGARAIGRATSTDGVTFTKIGQIINQQTIGTGEPSIVAYGANDLLFFDWSDGAATRQISLVMMSGLLLVGKNKAFFNASGAGWDAVQTFDSYPIVSGGKLYLFYAGAPTAGGSEGYGIQIGVATFTLP